MRKRSHRVRVREGLEDIADIDLLPRLGNARPKAARTRQNWISDVVLKLLTRAIDDLITISGIGDEDAISLVGRALFARFLGDRDLLPDAIGSASASRSLFDDAAQAAATSTWLDLTFNGDLLPLSGGIRHYGLLASSTHKDAMALARRLLGAAAPIEEPEPEEPLDHRPPCPCCGGHMTIVETFARWCQPRAPPSSTPPIRENAP